MIDLFFPSRPNGTRLPISKSKRCATPKSHKHKINIILKKQRVKQNGKRETYPKMDPTGRKGGKEFPHAKQTGGGGSRVGQELPGDVLNPLPTCGGGLGWGGMASGMTVGEVGAFTHPPAPSRQVSVDSEGGGEWYKKAPPATHRRGLKNQKSNNTAQGKPRSLLTRTALSWASLGIIFATASVFMARRISTASSSSILSSRGATLDGLMALYILIRFLNC